MKKVKYLILSIMLAASMLTGCSGGTTETGSGSTSGVSAEQESDENEVVEYVQEIEGDEEGGSITVDGAGDEMQVVEDEEEDSNKD